MPAVITKTIRSSGGDYTGLAAAIADLVNIVGGTDLVAADVQVVFLHGRASGDTSGTTIAGFTTDATHNVVIRRESNNGAGRTAFFGEDGRVEQRILVTSAMYVDVEGLAIVDQSTGTVIGYTSAVVAGTATLNIRRCWLKGGTGASSRGVLNDARTAAVCTVNVEGCIVQDCDGVTQGRAVMLSSIAGGNVVNTNNSLLVCCLHGVVDSGSIGGMNNLNTYAVREPTNAGYGFSATTATATSASSDGSDGSTAVSEAAWARVVSRHPKLLLYNDYTANVAAGVERDGRYALMRRAGSLIGPLTGDASVNSGTKLTGTTGSATFGETIVRGFANSLSGAVRCLMPATPTNRGLLQIKGNSDDLNRINFQIDASGNLEVVVFDNAGAGTALDYAPVGDNLAGTHEYGFRVHGGSIYLYLDGVEVATAAYAGVRDADDSWQVGVGVRSTNFLGAGAELYQVMLCEGSIVPIRLPMPLWDDALGALDVFALTPLSSATLKNGGTAAGAPTVDVQGLPLADRRAFGEASGHSIGAYGYHPTMTPGGDQLPAGATIAGDVVVLPGPVL